MIALDWYPISTYAEGAETEGLSLRVGHFRNPTSPENACWWAVSTQGSRRRLASGTTATKGAAAQAASKAATRILRKRAAAIDPRGMLR